MVLQAEGYQAMIAINVNLRYAERVFVLLHEFAHYILHPVNITSFIHADICDKAGLRRLEKQADLFAWTLMSEKLREEYLEEIQSGEDDTIPE